MGELDWYLTTTRQRNVQILCIFPGVYYTCSYRYLNARRGNSSELAMEVRLSCSDPSIYEDFGARSRYPEYCRMQLLFLAWDTCFLAPKALTSNGSWCMGIKGETSGTVCVTFTWDMYIHIWVLYSLCFFCCLFITVTWWYVWCIEWASGNQEEVQACLVTLWLFIISCYSLYKTTLGLLCSWFENNPHFHKYSMDFHV